jgi:SAM-dependent methyltransferase
VKLRLRRSGCGLEKHRSGSRPAVADDLLRHRNTPTLTKERTERSLLSHDASSSVPPPTRGTTSTIATRADQGRPRGVLSEILRGMEQLPDYVRRNRQAWDASAAEYEDIGRRAWQAEASWGIWSVLDEELHVLPENVVGMDAIELGCGTAYVSAWLARRGARPVGIDISEAQLRSARSFQRAFGLEFPLWHGNAEEIPAPDESFDLVISEYGASIWCDPYRWIPEASRVLRPGGELIFLVNGVIAVLTFPDDPDAPAGNRLLRPYFGLHRLEWSGEEGVNFHLPHGEMIALLRRCGLVVEQLIEVRPPEGSVAAFPLVTLEWARQWPGEEIWKARKPSQESSSPAGQSRKATDVTPT